MAEASLADVLWTLTIVGVFVGIGPIVIGMLWFPFISRLDPARLNAALALSAGVLAFVGVEMLSETIAYAEAADPTIAAGAAMIEGSPAPISSPSASARSPRSSGRSSTSSDSTRSASRRAETRSDS